MNNYTGISCNFKNCKLTRVYIPRQPYGRLFHLNEALKRGTLFANLYTPYPKKTYCK
ncbi:spore coat associated protein CotJA [Clostridium cochlearium]|uniref:Spore coat associated protein CotJA n=1 Tax=Clostridium cochlearium TaxID=1494 RepID=A0A7Y4DE79_CLOCO|nr:spore coat associated protein CotJA [Clostridium cochlearium]NSJ92437.1 spore coat associated protein CotJA [Coprococcus sp. MSK.21.13]MBE6064023.1 spore coat associated protein CotJA [Clostridium cochlearium]MBU5269675.1 spore coat associated protein CotJA [Clostridium cochlearium]MCG4571219.1 spore coat associated protein CotJA [Clostridium cochlearium]MCG4578748.1 spore coat associated protein CotJA [Clostridium cochlearium]